MLENLRNDTNEYETEVVDMKQANLTKQHDDDITALPLFDLNNGKNTTTESVV